MMNENDKTLKYLIYGTIVFVFGLVMFLGISLYSQHKAKQPKPTVVSMQEKQDKELASLKSKYFNETLSSLLKSFVVGTILIGFIIWFLISSIRGDACFWFLFFVPYAIGIWCGIHGANMNREEQIHGNSLVEGLTIFAIIYCLIGCPVSWWIMDNLRSKRRQKAYQKWFDSLPSLVDCPDCNKKVSKNAKTCPHCGSVFIEEIWESYSIGIWF